MRTREWFSDVTIAALFLSVAIAQNSGSGVLRGCQETRFPGASASGTLEFARAFRGRTEPLIRDGRLKQNASHVAEQVPLVVTGDSDSRAQVTWRFDDEEPCSAQQERANSQAHADRPGSSVGAPDPPGTTRSPNAPPDPNDYIIGEQDSLMITVWKEREISGGVVVRPDGKITVPLVGELKVVGMTPVQVQTVLAEKLKPFVTVPQVTVAVTQINSRKVYLIGQAAREGPFLINSSTTVLQIIAEAGGLRDFAKRKKIYILRNQGQQQIRFSFDYDAVIRGKKEDQNILLQPGDTIVVP
jgi:polysaccharide export outer membrane protein